MKGLFVGLLVIHGLIHFIGVAAAFRLADVPLLTQPISRGFGVVWLLAGITTLATAAALLASVRIWWAIGLVAVVLSQAAIAASWSDAAFGTVANVLLLAGVVYGFAAGGPLGFRAEYARQVRTRLAEATPTEPAVVTESDLERLPEAVRRYLRLSGAVGRPRVTHVRASWRGRIRATPDDAWMSFTAEQYDFVSEPSRFFLMDARRGGLPVDVLHVYAAGDASMRVRLLSLFPLVRERGRDLRRTETVTVFNDLCLLAPGALVDPAIEWEEIDARQVRARYASGEHVVSAVLVFDDEGWLVDFFSDDRLAFTEGGPRRWRWSTPVSGYKAYGPVHAASRGAGWWHAPEGPFAYVELELVDLELNGGRETLHSPELRAHLHIHAQRPGTRPLRSGDPRSPSRSKDGTS